MALLDFSIAKDHFDKSGWEHVIASCPLKTCSSYCDGFRAKAKEAEQSGDTDCQSVYRMLACLTSMYLQPDNRTEPFAPMMVMKNSRTAILDDFSDEQLEILKELVPNVSDPEMRARLADVLWVRNRDFRMGELAIDAYLESAVTLEDPEDWPECAHRIERALGLAATLGKNSDRFSRVISHIEDVLHRLNGEDPLFLSAQLMELLQEHRQGDATMYASLAEKCAVHAESEKDWHRAREYWERKARWHAIVEDENGNREALVRVAESYVEEAEEALKQDPPSYLAAAGNYQSAIEALRRIGGTKERRDELHQRLINCQEIAVGELKTISAQVDVTQLAEGAINLVRGKGLVEALFALALSYRSPQVSDLRRQTEERIRQYPLSSLISGIMLNESGKTVARRPSVASDDPSEIEVAIRAEMLNQAQMFHAVHSGGVIRPAVSQIHMEHRVRLPDFHPIVSDNPFVPPGREIIYAEGLYAGLAEDFLKAGHLLIPQLENSTRYILNQVGVVTSGLDANGIQNEFDLNTTLYVPELEQILEEDTLFDLRGLLVEHAGGNLRNRMAHGLIGYYDFFSPQFVYLWWLALRLCCLFKRAIMSQEKKNGCKENE